MLRVGVGNTLIDLHTGGGGNKLNRIGRLGSYGVGLSGAAATSQSTAALRSYGVGLSGLSGVGESFGRAASFGVGLSSVVGSSASDLGAILGTKLQVWYDFADTGTLWADAAKTTLAANGGGVHVVASKVGGATRDAVWRGAGFAQATRTDGGQNGRTVGTFVASTFTAYNGPNTGFAANVMGAFVVVRCSNNSSPMAILGNNVTSVGGLTVIFNRSGVGGSESAQGYSSGGQTFSTAFASSVGVTTTRVYYVLQDIGLATNEVDVRIDNTSPTLTRPQNGNNTTVNRNQTLLFGQDPNFAAYFDGIVCEVGVVNATPTAGEISDAFNALKAKWGTP